jgi:hypothetical protein
VYLSMNTSSPRRRLSAHPRARRQQQPAPHRTLSACAGAALAASLCLLTAGVSTAQVPGGSEDADTPPMQPPAAPAMGALPVGSIVAFAPAASGFSGTADELRAWLDARGWALCDGTRGTPDLSGRMLLGTTDAGRVGERLGSQDHDHRVQGESAAPLLRNRHTRVGLAELKHLPDDQHRHRVDITSDRAGHLPPSTRVLFIMKLR